MYFHRLQKKWFMQFISYCIDPCLEPSNPWTGRKHTKIEQICKH